MNAPFLSFETQYTPLSSALTDAFARMYDSCWYVPGKEEKQFEKEYAAFKHVPHTIGAVNGLGDLALVLQVRDIDFGDKVTVPSSTCNPAGRDAGRCATRSCGVRPRCRQYRPSLTGGRPHTAYPRIILSHPYGQACRMTVIMPFARRQGSHAIEDKA